MPSGMLDIAMPRVRVRPVYTLEERQVMSEAMALERHERELDPDGYQRKAEVVEAKDRLRVQEDARALLASERVAEIARGDRRVRVHRGDEFVLDLPPLPPILWGLDGQTLWIEGEALLLVGGDGVGKSTIGQQLVCALIGLRKGFLGYPVKPFPTGRVLYLAMDRPAQIGRSFARMVAETDRDALHDRLAFWSGPLPIDPLSHPTALADWIAETFGDDIVAVVADSYKDLVPGISEDKPGSQLNLAMQEVLARGIQWIGLHHQRKPASDRTGDYTLADVYGSRWLTAGAGSVFMILGDAGDSTVELRHVKQPMEVVGPLLVTHDHARGVSTRRTAHATVSGVLMTSEGQRFTVNELCEEVYGGVDVRLRKRVERELRRLDADPESGVSVEKGARGGASGTAPSQWYFATDSHGRKVTLSGNGVSA